MSENPTELQKQYEDLVEQARRIASHPSTDNKEEYANQVVKARGLLKQAIALDPNRPSAYYWQFQLAEKAPVKSLPDGFDSLFLAIKHTASFSEAKSDLWMLSYTFFPQPTGFKIAGVTYPKLCALPTLEQVEKVVDFLHEKLAKDKISNEDLRCYKTIYEDFIRQTEPLYNSNKLRKFKIELAQGLIEHKTTKSSTKYKIDQYIMYLKLEDSEKATQIAQQILAEAPGYIEERALKMAAQWEFSVNDLDELHDLITFDHECAPAYYGLARAVEHLHSKSAKVIIDYYRAAARLSKGKTDAWQNTCYLRLVMLLQLEEMHREVFVLLEESGDIARLDPALSLEKARAFKALGQFSQAFHEYEHVQALVNKDDPKKDSKELQEIDAKCTKEKEELLKHFGKKVIEEETDNLKQILNYDPRGQMKKEMAIIAQDKALANYYDQFMFSFTSLYSTSQAITSGSLTLDSKNTWAGLGAKALPMLPFYGNTLESIFSSVSQQKVSSSDIKKKAKVFCSFAPNQAAFDATVSDIARKIVTNPIKKKRIIRLTKEDKQPSASSFWTELEEVYAGFKSVPEFENYNLLSSTPAARQALEDVTVLIVGLMKNENLMKKDGSTRDDEIVDLFFDLTEEHEKQDIKAAGKAPQVEKVGGHKREKSKGGLLGFLGCGTTNRKVRAEEDSIRK